MGASLPVRIFFMGSKEFFFCVTARQLKGVLINRRIKIRKCIQVVD